MRKDSARAMGRKNVVLITMSGLRADRLGCYGYRGVETPLIDSMAAGGIVFEKVLSPAPNSWVSSASILTGCNPVRHGIHRPYDRLKQGVLTMAEILSEHGYATAGFPAHDVVGRLARLHRGFFKFHDGWPSFGENPTSDGWQHNWQKSVDGAGEWLAETDAPFFLWFHYRDIESMIGTETLPVQYRERFSERWGCYDGKISYADSHCVETVKNLVKEMRPHEETMFVLCSDHGRDLSCDRIPAHNGSIREETLHVPLVISPVDEPLKGRRHQGLAGAIDILPTMLDMIGIDPSLYRLDGTNLNAEESGGGRDCYMENLPRGYVGLRTDPWKIVIRTDPRKFRGLQVLGIEGLYNLEADPWERSDFSRTESDTVGKLLDRLTDVLGPGNQFLLNEEKVA